MKRSLLYLFVICLGALVISGCGGGEKSIENEDYLAARAEDWTLTKEYLYDFIDQLPDYQKEKYDNPRGRAELADNFINDELYYLEAKRLNLAERDWVKARIETITRQIMVEAYVTAYIETPARPSEEEMMEYYNTHQDVYSSLPVVRAQHIFSTSKEKLEDLKVRIEDGGEKMTTLAHDYSEDKITQLDGGDLGYFNNGGYVRGIGFSEIFCDTVFKMEPKKVYGPIKWEKGYSLVRVNERRESQLKPFPEVKNEISEMLMSQRVDEVKRKVIAEFREKYDWRNYMEEQYKQIQRTPKELFEYAQNTTDPYERIAAFEEIVDKFPDDEHAPQAMFMIGFVYVEELSDKVSAGRMFSQLISKYPDSDVAESARWMRDNLDKPLPEFENLDELNQKLSGESD